MIRIGRGKSARSGMDWQHFLETYFRPHLVVVNLPTASHVTARRKLIGLLEHLVDCLNSAADYAMVQKQDRVAVIAFERDLDAEVIGKVLGARAIERGGEQWASKTVCNLDPSATRSSLANRLKSAKRNPSASSHGRARALEAKR